MKQRVFDCVTLMTVSIYFQMFCFIYLRNDYVISISAFVSHTLYMGGAKRKGAFKHVQNARNQIILHMRKASLGPRSPFIHSVVASDSVSEQ